MATKKKMLQAAAGSATGGAALDITDVFSTYLYDGTGSAQTITNGIDLAGEGGLVWIKKRNGAVDHYLADTERGATKFLVSNTTDVEDTNASTLTSFNSNGFTIGDNSRVNSYTLTDTFASWTFRKAPKFFDVVEYSYQGNTAGTTAQIAHSLGSAPGLILIKAKDKAESFIVWHKDVNGYFKLAETSPVYTGTGAFGSSPSMTDTHFSVGYDGATNFPGYNYVAYLFAHNNGDGEFGPDADQDIIKCGSYTGNGSTDGPEIDLGFEPQLVMIKRSSAAEDWLIFDNMRGLLVGGIDPDLRPNQAQAEGSFLNYLEPNATGFKLIDPNTRSNFSGDTYIYIAIRRGPLAQPESGTEVFAVESSTAGSGTLPLDIIPSIGFAPDWGFVIRNIISGSRGGTLPFIGTRLLGYGKSLLTDRSNAEGTTTIYDFATSDAPLVGDAGGANDPGAENIHWLWKRASGFCDVVAYSGLGGAGSISHNLSATPEMIWFKNRNDIQEWIVYHKDLTAGNHLRLNGTNAELTGELTASFAVSDTQFTFANDFITTNSSGYNYIAYLFASLDGISKVGSFSITGSGLNIDCGFTSGARFILFKRTDSAGDWWVHDTVRGINASAIDPYLKINTADAEGTNLSLVEPLASGFTVTSALGSGDYIFYAIA